MNRPERLSWKLNRAVKGLANAILNPFGFRLERKPRSNRYVTKQASLGLLKGLGVVPQTVIDVGIRHGPEFGDVFPDVKHVLIEPAQEFEPWIRQACGGLKDVNVIWAAASNQSGLTTFKGENGVRRTVDKVTLDQVCREGRLKGPYVIKVDVDGKDLEVLEGASEILGETDAIVIEVPIRKWSERTQFLESRGFFLWDVVDLMYYEGVLEQVDLVYCNQRLNRLPFLPWKRDRRGSQFCGTHV
jgi:FkbM family methyltransferase